MKVTLALLTAILLASLAQAQTFKVVYSFSFTDGSSPNGSLLRDSDGNFYGTTLFGGKSNRGVVFKLDSAGHYTSLYQFTGQADGGLPIGRLIRDSAGNLYGVTSLGGDPTCSCGTVFELQTNGTLTVLHAFQGGQDGAQNSGQPQLGLVQIGNDFYGSASFGGVAGCDGSLGCGVVYQVTPTQQETVLYRFTAQADGGFPQDLISDTSGEIYGETGGSYSAGNGGTIFKMDTSGNLTTLYTFPEGARGTSPRYGLLRHDDGTFYGVTQYGGTSNCALTSAGCGVVFTLNAKSKEHVLHTFGKKSKDGAMPYGALLEIAPNFYGVTAYGGITNSICTFGCGTVYRVTATHKYKLLYRFTGGADGWLPNGGLTEDDAGNLYGAAQSGGNNSNGVIFEITP